MEIMIAAAMLGILTMGVLKLVEMQRQTAQRGEQNFSITSLLMEVGSYLNDTVACQQSLQGQRLNTSDIEIKNSRGKTRFKSGDKIANDLQLEKIGLLSGKDEIGPGERGVAVVELKIKRENNVLTKNLSVMVTLDDDGAVKTCGSQNGSALQSDELVEVQTKILESLLQTAKTLEMFRERIEKNEQAILELKDQIKKVQPQ